MSASHYTYLRVDPSEKLEVIEAVLPPGLRRGRFKAPDALIATLLGPDISRHTGRPSPQPGLHSSPGP